MSDPKDDTLSQEDIDSLLADSPAEPAAAEEAVPPLPPDAKVVEGVDVTDADDAALDQEGMDEVLEQLGGAAGPPAGATGAFDLPEVDSPAPAGNEPVAENQIELLKDVHVRVRVELGRGSMYLRDILRLANGSVVELEKLAGDPLDIYVNDRLIAKGEVLVLNENFCIRVTEIFSPKEVLRLTT
jgi:flagellar motor switch protein FliN/FliY